jgi:hypothetical protein
METQTLCDCASGYYGINFCEPLSQKIMLPSLLSQRQQGSPIQSANFIIGSTSYKLQGIQAISHETSIRSFSIQPGDQVVGGSNISVQLAVVDSVFEVDMQNGGNAGPGSLPPTIHIESALNERIQIRLMSDSFLFRGMRLLDAEDA